MTDKERIYLNEIPKRWEECPYARYEEAYGNGHYCILRDGICPRLSEKTANEHKQLIEQCCPLKTIQSIQNQRAVEALQKVKEYVNKPFDSDGCFKTAGDIYDYIDNLIKEYGGNNNE